MNRAPGEMEGVVFVLVALVVGALGVWIGILVAPRMTRFAERADEAREGAAADAEDADAGGSGAVNEPWSGGRITDPERKDEPPGDDRH